MTHFAQFLGRSHRTFRQYCGRSTATRADNAGFTLLKQRKAIRYRGHSLTNQTSPTFAFTY